MEREKEEDLYAALGVPFGATAQEISRAYRAKALQLHPDKQHGSAAARAQAAALFAVVQKAKEVLLDERARAAYDAVVRAQQQRRARAQQLDAQRQAMAARLEANDPLVRGSSVPTAQDPMQEERAARQRLEAEIRRLREEGRLRPSTPVAVAKREHEGGGELPAKTPRRTAPTRIVDDFDAFEAEVLARAAKCAETQPIVIT